MPWQGHCTPLRPLPAAPRNPSSGAGKGLGVIYNLQMFPGGRGLLSLKPLVRFSIRKSWLLGAPESWGLPHRAPCPWLKTETVSRESRSVSSLGSGGNYLVKMDFFFFWAVKITEKHNPCHFTRPLHGLERKALQVLIICGENAPGGLTASREGRRPSPALEAWASTLLQGSGSSGAEPCLSRKAGVM